MADLAPWNFSLFSKLKVAIKRERFDTISDVHKASLEIKRERFDVHKASLEILKTILRMRCGGGEESLRNTMDRQND